jgi:hypothetical protein
MNLSTHFVAAYAVAIGEQIGRLPHYCAVLHIPNANSEAPTVTEVNSFSSAELFPIFQAFLAAKRLFEWLSAVQVEQATPMEQPGSSNVIPI